MTPTTIKNLIESQLPNCQVQLDGDGRHFQAIVISPIFEGLSRVKKQQTVYAVLKNQIDDGSLHAISFTTYTPEEWQLKKEST